MLPCASGKQLLTACCASQVRWVPDDLAGLAERLSCRHALASAKQAQRLDMAFKALSEAARVSPLSYAPAG